MAVGHVRNANPGYRALVYGDQGILKVCGDKEGRAPLPVGQWKLLMYTIDRTGERRSGQAGGRTAVAAASARRCAAAT